MTANPRAAELRDRFDAEGWGGPFPVLTAAECRLVMRSLGRGASGPPAVWYKGHAASSPLFFELATRSKVLDAVRAILGEDVLLWGASVVRRRPKQTHHWHTDIETSDPGGRAVSVWIGLENTDRRSSLRLVTRSHRFGVTVQEVAAGKGTGREDAEDVRAWAQERDPASELVQPQVRDGDAVLFDGRLWHGSTHTGRSERSALLLQYAVPDMRIRMPDLTRLEWPFRFLEAPRPPCVMVRGSDRCGMNRIAPAPPRNAGERPVLTTWIQSLELPLKRDEDRGWKPYPVFRGPTPNVADLSCHVSVLDPGVTPHPPHDHLEEELLVVLDGEAELVLDGEGAGRSRVARAGTVAYYPVHQRHTIRGAGPRPVTYLMLKWRGHGSAAESHLETGVFEDDASAGIEVADGFRVRRIVEGPTRYLGKLHAHVTTLAPGAGYRPHVDAHDVAILVLAGVVETLGTRVGRHGVVFCAGGEPHGMRNVGDGPARYLVFEFHKNEADLTALKPRFMGRIWKLVPRRLRRLLRLLLFR